MFFKHRDLVHHAFLLLVVKPLRRVKQPACQGAANGMSSSEE